jgi:hypothetical protein
MDRFDMMMIMADKCAQSIELVYNYVNTFGEFVEICSLEYYVGEPSFRVIFKNVAPEFYMVHGMIIYYPVDALGNRDFGYTEYDIRNPSTIHIALVDIYGNLFFASALGYQGFRVYDVPIIQDIGVIIAEIKRVAAIVSGDFAKFSAPGIIEPNVFVGKICAQEEHDDLPTDASKDMNQAVQAPKDQDNPLTDIQSIRQAKKEKYYCLSGKSKSYAYKDQCKYAMNLFQDNWEKILSGMRQMHCYNLYYLMRKLDTTGDLFLIGKIIMDHKFQNYIKRLLNPEACVCTIEEQQVGDKIRNVVKIHSEFKKLN